MCLQQQKGNNSLLIYYCYISHWGKALILNFIQRNLVTKISSFLLNSKFEIHNEKWKISRLFLLFLGIRSGSGSSTANGTRNLRQSAGNSSIVSGQANSDLRKKEVVLAKISLYMVFVFLICHSVKIVPNIFEMVQTYYEVRTKFSTSVF